MAVVPFVFANSTGPIPLSELDVNFANVKAFAETAGNVTSNVQANITQVGVLTSLTVSGSAVASNFTGNLTGNVTGNVAGNLVGNVIGNLIGNVTGNISGNLVVAGANTGVLFNDSGVANAVAALTFAKSNNFLSINGNIHAAGAITTNAVIDANTVVVSSGVVGVPAGTLNFFLANNVPTTMYIGGHASNVYLANVNSTTRIAGNATVGGTLSATGNITVGGNLIATGNSALSGNATAATAANGTATTQIATTAFVTNTAQNLIPTGVIVMWSGSIASIPAGWALCDGANATPDLRDRFIVGAGSSYAVAATGGSANAIVVSHSHTATSSVTDPGHSHTYNDTLLLADYFGNGSNATTQTTSSTSTATTGITVSTTVNSTGSSGTNANLPPYYALAYIMKL